MVTNVAVFTNLSVVFTNAYAVTSQVATLSVLAPPGISVQPLDLTRITGSNASFTVTPTAAATR